MAEIVRIKSELKSLGESLGFSGPELVDFMNVEMDKINKAQKEQNDFRLKELEMEKEIRIKEIEKEIKLKELEAQKETSHNANINAHNETQGNSFSPISSNIDHNINGNSHPSLFFPLDPFNDKVETVEIFLNRFEKLAETYELPEDKWNI